MIGLETGVIGLVLAYVLLSTLLLVVLIWLPIPRLAKVAAIVAASVFYVVVFFASQRLLGWSAPVAVPERFQVLWTRVIEPNPSRNNPGAIHLWVEELDDANLPSGEPRAFRLPYTVELARRISSAQAEIEEGRPQGGRAQFFGAPSGQKMGAAPVNAAAPPGGDPSGGGMFDPSLLGAQSRSVTLEPLPKPKLPAKDLP
jgi:hypothetical protein